MSLPRITALQLMERLIAREISVPEFCSLYEHHFNFDWPNRSSEPQAELFDKLFDVVAWYTPFPEERELIPNYTGDEDILRMVPIVRAQAAA